MPRSSGCVKVKDRVLELYADSGIHLLESIIVTKATVFPIFSKMVAISTATTPPKEYPARKYGPFGSCLRSNSVQASASTLMDL